jgi:hypothetical protein
VVVDTQTKTEARVAATALTPLSSLDDKALALRQAMTEEEFLDAALERIRKTRKLPEWVVSYAGEEEDFG